jgi:hypothetical protein
MTFWNEAVRGFNDLEPEDGGRIFKWNIPVLLQ